LLQQQVDSTLLCLVADVQLPTFLPLPLHCRCTAFAAAQAMIASVVKQAAQVWPADAQLLVST
jgi:hypothetical protein